MPMPETAAGIASVNQAPAVFEVEVNSLTTDDGERRAIAGIQPGPQKSTHRSLHPTVRRAKPRSSRADIMQTILGRLRSFPEPERHRVREPEFCARTAFI
jgi:hypothetical protein